MSIAAGMPEANVLRKCGVPRAACRSVSERASARTAAYQVVRRSLETWLAQLRADLDTEQAFCYSLTTFSKLVNGVFTE